MALRELQERFQSHLLAGDEAICAMIAERAPLRSAERVAIYRNAYGARLTDALKSNYPKLRLVLGDELFSDVATGYAAAHPSRTRSIRWFGTHLADHLVRTPPFAAQPLLAELARFEWAMNGCFDAADAPVLDRRQLAATAPQDWGALCFAFHPSLRTLSLAWNTVEIWKALDADPQAPAPTPLKATEAGSWLLWRQQFRNRFRSISDAEATALAWAMDGASFAEICERLMPLVPQDQVPLTAATLLANWAESGLLQQRP